jgi:hypothetical protein
LIEAFKAPLNLTDNTWRRNEMRAILIDPVTRTVTETEHVGDDWRDIGRLLDCESIESAGMLSGISLATGTVFTSTARHCSMRPIRRPTISRGAQSAA